MMVDFDYYVFISYTQDGKRVKESRSWGDEWVTLTVEKWEFVKRENLFETIDGYQSSVPGFKLISASRV